MYKTYLKRINLLYNGIINMGIGIALLFLQGDFAFAATIVLAFALIQNGIYLLVKSILKNKKGERGKLPLGSAIINIFLGCILIAFTDEAITFVLIVFSLYALFKGLIKGITWISYRQNNYQKGRLRLFTESLLNLLIGLGGLFFTGTLYPVAIIIISSYFILYGLFLVYDFLSDMVSSGTKDRLKRKVRLCPPLFLTTLIPHEMLRKINEGLTPEGAPAADYDGQTDNAPPDMEVLIHVTKEGYGVFGHMDLYFDGKVITYGNYDEDSYRLFKTVGNGILFTTPKKGEYIDFCGRQSKKTIFSFGLRLSEEMKNAVREEIKEIKKNVTEWLPKCRRGSPDDCEDYASRLYRATGAEFFEFTKGKFKTYIIFTTNCVLLADEIIGRSGSDLLSLNGIITPGTYFDYLQKEYLKGSSFVVSRHIYTPKEN